MLDKTGEGPFLFWPHNQGKRMAEDAVAGTSSGQSQTASGDTGSSVSSAPNTGLSPADATRLQGSGDGQAALKNQLPNGNQESGQASTAPAQPGKPAEQPVAQASKPAWDADSESWLKSKGWEVSHFDPSNETHKKMIESSRSSEAALTKAMQAAKAMETFQRTESIVSQKANAEPAKSPLDTFTESHAAKIQTAMDLHGYDNPDAFARDFPDIAVKLNAEYHSGRQEAWEKTQDWKTEQGKLSQKQQDEFKAFQKDLDDAKRFTEKNFTTLQAKYPTIQKDFKDTGVDNLINSLSQISGFPKEFLLAEQSTVAWLAEAASAMQYVKGEPARKEAWQKEYEQNLLKAKEAQLPAVAGPDTVSDFARSKNSGDWRQNLEASVIK